ncbi:hypothetical protein pEaSNUABM47_00424 [Erwinia phage pEa_SNUABM_47]|uniref:Uncharacterized protein n=1 Tax=Erwinia phage pEa_SNUABM_47 TaxID=2768774 RepID=A0A7L8ZP20_9CAUD|nr:hypothetical protein pEaSNUABM47_00424 [Erwinia phage pEa_SNUABM_47]
MILTLIFLWSLLNSISGLVMATKAVLIGDYSTFSYRVGNSLLFTIVCIDAFLRIFSVTQTGLW